MRYLFFACVVIIAFTSQTTTKEIQITGTVTDEKGAPLIHVSVMEKGTKNGTSTDANGLFQLKVSKPNAVLQFSFVGLETVEVKLGGKVSVSIKMKPTEHHLSEVVVIGYSSPRYKKDLSYPSPKIYGYQSGVPGSSVDYLLQGRVAGVSIAGKRKRVQTDKEMNTEDYDGIIENRFHRVTDEPLSTFSIDVDGASYSNVRRMINAGQLPPADAVRIEEFINYFKYKYPQPQGNDPFSITTEMSNCPWNEKHKLVMVGLQGKQMSTENLPPSNLVFLIDVSGSMEDPNKLPLVKASLRLLVNQLREQDHVAIVVYAGAAGLVLPSTSGMNKEKILAAIDNLSAGGSTAGGAGIQLAYRTAKENFKKQGNNRVILCTDGDFNVGISSDGELERMIEEERKSGVFLTVLGYGMGNYKDNKMQKLADKGNGNHAYIDGMNEAKKVLVNEFGGTLFTIAKDVKLQIEFNPSIVAGYRLIGYENRMLNKEDFNNDKKDAGDLGSGHTVTAIYEIIPAGVEDEFLEDVDELKYQQHKKTKKGSAREMMTIKFRYKSPEAETSKLIVHTVADTITALQNTSENFRFACAVVQFGMLLRNSEFKGNASYERVIQLANSSLGKDEEGYRKEFVKLVHFVSSISKK
ncbi:von Willebrand factor type A domain-containing protein [Lacibacter sp. MH-610]|uniref:vWA domain-containing protein n=1 Tax=Lacibacter sp. MH-610 TaxID=3020883 RepID=UPI003892253F